MAKTTREHTLDVIKMLSVAAAVVTALGQLERCSPYQSKAMAAREHREIMDTGETKLREAKTFIVDKMESNQEKIYSELKEQREKLYDTQVEIQKDLNQVLRELRRRRHGD